MVQKNSSTPGNPASKRVTSEAKVIALSWVPSKSSVRNDSAASPSGATSPQVLGHVEHLDQAGGAAAEHRHVCAIGRGPAQRRLQHLAGHAHLELDLHADDIGEE